MTRHKRLTAAEPGAILSLSPERQEGRSWSGAIVAVAALSRWVALAFRVAERLFIVAIIGTIMLAFHGAGKFDNGGWRTILAIAVAVWVLAVIFKDERER